ncbi:MAG: sulfotransferase family protein [Bacteroidota bacterium]
MAVPRIINMWAGPRNISTTLMYSFAQRLDTKVVDEPLYAHYLHHTGLDHPGREETLNAYSNDGQAIMEGFLQREEEKPLLFLKNMGQHYVELNSDGFMAGMDHIFLIRRPDQVVASFSKVIRHPQLADIAIAKQCMLFDMVKKLGKKTLVLDGNEVLKNPKKVLDEMCQRLGIPFQGNMLQWEAGVRPEDGTWAPYWYHNVHQSTGFKPWAPKKVMVHEDLRPLVEEAMPFYERMFKEAIKA